jgi:hypothetical protein
MKDLLEQLVYLAGAVLLWGKLGSIALSLGLVIYGCYRLCKFLERIHLLRSCQTCQ